MGETISGENVGSEHVGSEHVGGETFRPEDEKGVAEAICWAVAEKRPLEILGNGSKRAIGRPLQTEYGLSLSRLSGIVLYEPEELVLSARAGTPLAEIEAMLEENGQQLAFEPIDPGEFLGGEPRPATIGGVVATNLSGPRRLKAGAVRDHVLGVKAVSGRGEAFKSGGRVMKNVTGYDLARGLAGSWGTLAALTEITVKVQPRAETESTVCVLGLDEAVAVEVMAMAAGSCYEISSAAHLPAAVLGGTVFEGLGRSATVLRLEGFAPSVGYRAEKLRQLLAGQGPIEVIEGESARAGWREIGNAVPFAASQGALWRLSCAPTHGPAITARIAAEREIRVLFDWAGGLIWLETGFHDDAGAATIRAALAGTGGHATLIRAPAAMRAAIPVFHPQPPPLAALSARFKREFDPHGILNPGRMHAGS